MVLFDLNGADAFSRLLRHIAENSTSRNGAWTLRSGGRDLAVVLIEGGRICWAAAPGGQRRLTDILVERCGIEREEIERVCTECRASGAPIGEALVKRGGLPPAALQSALLEHTAGVLLELAQQASIEASWQPHKGRGYDPRYTFSFGQLLLHGTRRRSTTDLAALERRLAALCEPGMLGLTFETSCLPFRPLAFYGVDSFELDALPELFAFTSSLVENASQTDRPRVIASLGTLGLVLVLNEPTVRTLIVGADNASFSRVLARCARG